MSVSAKQPLVVKDACVFFDLIDLGILERFYELKISVITTPEVINEIEQDDQRLEVQQYIDSGQIIIDEAGELTTILAITESQPRLSLTDASVLDVATRYNAMILSSDRSLRTEAINRGIEVHGMLWIIEQLYMHGILTIELVIEKLEQYPTVNGWAPKKAIEILISKFQKLKNL